MIKVNEITSQYVLLCIENIESFRRENPANKYTISSGKQSEHGKSARFILPSSFLPAVEWGGSALHREDCSSAVTSSVERYQGISVQWHCDVLVWMYCCIIRKIRVKCLSSDSSLEMMCLCCCNSDGVYNSCITFTKRVFLSQAFRHKKTNFIVQCHTVFCACWLLC